MLNYTELMNSVLAEKRLQSYGSLNPTFLPETVAHYLWNIQLCEALYPVLYSLEIALRNRINLELALKTSYPKWLFPKHGILIGKDKEHLKRLIKHFGDEKTTKMDDVIAALTLDFWVGLFSHRYEQSLWRGHSLRGVFPCAPKSELACHSIRFKLYRIKYLRNRVFHHEPIWRWKDLDCTYDDIVKLISWLSQDWSKLLPLLDRFQVVHQQKHQTILDKLNRL